MNEDDLGKFDSRTNKDIFLDYAFGSKAYNATTTLWKVVESIDVKVVEAIPQKENLQKNKDLNETIYKNEKRKKKRNKKRKKKK